MRRVLVTGGAGQLGSDIAREFSKEFEVVSVDVPDFDITNLDVTIQHLRGLKPHVIVHCAALTDVDECETEVDKTYLVNGIGARNVAIAAHKVGSRLVYISTDYVFDGEKAGPYREHDCPNPKTIYGMSKLMGERFVKQQTHAHFILRIAWLYGRTGHNFVKTILRSAQTRSELRVVDDQRGTPTWTVDVARQVQRLLQTDAYGTYHATSQGSCSWFDFAGAVLAEAGLDTPIIPVATAEFPRPAPRPKNSVLDNFLLRIQGMDIMPPWQDSLKQFMTTIDRQWARGDGQQSEGWNHEQDRKT
ncbi:dTDP-4-dehydrorhamnose reductase [Candidatus Bipolaricaulota bacterium]